MDKRSIGPGVAPDHAKAGRPAAGRSKRPSQQEAPGLHGKLTRLLDGSLNEIYFLNAETLRFDFVSPGALRNLGYTAEEIYGMTPVDLRVEPLTLEQFKATLAPLASHRVEQLVYESVHRRKDGSTYPTEVHVQLLERGGAQQYVAIILDITKRLSAEAGTGESEYFLRQAQRIGRIGIYKTDFLAGTWVSSPVLDDIFGIGPDYQRTITGWLGLVHPQEQEAMARYLEDEVIGKRRTFDREYRIRRISDGRTIWVHGTGEVAFDASGRVLSMIGTIQDVTRRREAEDALRFKNYAFDDTMTGNLIADREGFVTEANGAFLRLWGYPRREEVIGRPVPFFFGEPGAAGPVLAALNAWGHWEGDFEAKRRDGTAFVAHGLATLVRDGHGQSVGYQFTTLDVTEREHAEKERESLRAQLAQAQKMESVGRLAGGVAHDFNNMLSVIIGIAELELEQVDPAAPLYGSLKGILKAAGRSADLTRQLLAFARKQTVAPRVIDLNESIGSMLTMLRRLIGEDVDLRWRPQAGLWNIKVDPSQVDQVLVNLCVNARDAIVGHGEICIETANTELDRAFCAGREGLVPGDFVLLSVRDKGHGMDAATLAKVFEPFFTTKPTGKGTGLGLSTVYGIVKQNKGLIDVESSPGKGATFRVYLPRQEAEPQARESAPERPVVAREKAAILVVEDEPAFLRLTARVLENRGYSVLAAQSPSEALKLARENPGRLNLVLTDVIMPEMNGLELAATLVGLQPGLKCLFMSGYTADVIASQGVLEEGLEFLQKPFSMQELAQKVAAVLDKR